jgi:drug/metabolite transporter (DMT)-like permease
MQPAASSHQATRFGLGAILLWASLAALTTACADIPPFQLAAMTFAIATGVGIAWTWSTERTLRPLLRPSLPALGLGLYGLLAFHVCYFFALQRAPAIEASLIIYLWPLLIVVLAAGLPVASGGTRLEWRHLLGALMGLAGTALIILARPESPGAARHVDGYILAGLAAFIWASYSVASRLLSSTPTATVTTSCAATAIGAYFLHRVLEAPVLPATVSGWLAIAALGLGPVGLAFYLWDEGMKRGDIRLLGVASYATPLLSTVLLAALGIGSIGVSVALAAVLITAGAALASRK